MSKTELMNEVVKEILTCKKCTLWKFRRNPVPGEGSLDAKIMFIGEAPGYWEDVKGKPFVGAAGKLLDKLLAEVELSRSEVFIGNILKCRPPENRDPQPEEVEACTPYLDRQIEIIKPKIIVTLGRHSTAYIFSKVKMSFNGIGKVHGKVYQVKLLGKEIVLIPMYHPAAALYNVKLRNSLKQDFKVLEFEVRKLGSSRVI